MGFVESKIPIVQAPMVGSGAALAAAVCKAGGIGSLACAALSPDQAREAVAAVRAAAGRDAPLNLNFFCHQAPAFDPETQRRWIETLAPYYAEIGLDIAKAGAGPGRAPFDAAMCEVVEETRPPIVSFHFGLPAPALLDRVKATGAQVWSSATTVREARWLRDRGVDAVIAQGLEAGGHRGMFLDTDIGAQPGLFALLPQVVDAVDVPVIAAGGIADGRGIAAALQLGARAVQIGTGYLLTPQAGRSALHRKALERATDDATRLTNLYTGRPARGIATRLMREIGPISAAAPAFPLATGAVDPVRLAFEAQGRDDLSVLWSGEAAALARAEDAETLTRRLWDEARSRLAEMARAWS
ncbi:2-nitropropane dioxygenase [Rhodoplanes elegans]|uniref:Nitronate monooxygenase n=1 Tax=Rhodoplanes elegans TaxID=29408 RepID=A0A327JTY5_9BRAD|nr:nitronate monooxygenase [Rhodoplanes elegans]MBK5956974.1 2-nitropropane dioxygenase [Rhodoplanes elegans]RAI29065.1 2-nitropropane dioxygenase [Rhodoplanes elegans]